MLLRALHYQRLFDPRSGAMSLHGTPVWAVRRSITHSFDQSFLSSCSQSICSKGKHWQPEAALRSAPQTVQTWSPLCPTHNWVTWSCTSVSDGPGDHSTPGWTIRSRSGRNDDGMQPWLKWIQSQFVLDLFVSETRSLSLRQLGGQCLVGLEAID